MAVVYAMIALSISSLITLPMAGYPYEKGMYGATIVVGILSIVLLIILALL